MARRIKALSEDEVIEIFEARGAIQNGHFVYTSGRHGEVYVNKDAVIPWPVDLSRLCAMFAKKFRLPEVEVVAAPAIGGVALSQWTAHHLGPKIPAVYAEKHEGELVFRRKYDQLVANKRVLVVEDIVTTGGSIEKLMSRVRELNGEVVGVGILWNRGGVEFDVRSVSLCARQYQSWDKDECPLCQKGVNFTTGLGHAAA